MRVLVLNCGSSSVKYQLIDIEREATLCRGLVEKIGQPAPRIVHQWNGEPHELHPAIADHYGALMQVRDLIFNTALGGVGHAGDIAAVGHRVVHGGESCVASMVITDEVIGIIEENAILAPLHNPPNLVGIRAAREIFPDLPHVAVFDTAFHQTMPEEAFLYPIPYELYVEDHIRRYGFHGTSHRYVALRAAAMLGHAGAGFTGITCHLGNGCSLAAVREGRSVDTSMGLTPLEGVAMGTRSGDLDPAIIFHLVEQKGMTLAQVNALLNRRSGLLGLSGLSNDLREIHGAAAAGNRRARTAENVYAYRIKKYIGAYLAVLGGAEAIVMTGGVGENSASMRALILGGLGGLGIRLDAARNAECRGSECDIAAADSPTRILVIPTNEELMIARDTRDVLGAARVALNDKAAIGRLRCRPAAAPGPRSVP